MKDIPKRWLTRSLNTNIGRLRRKEEKLNKQNKKKEIFF